MTSIIPFRSEQVAPYWAAAITAVCGRTALPRPQEMELLEQAIALCDAQAKLRTPFTVPPDGAPIRVAVTKAVILMHSDVYQFDREGSWEEEHHRLVMWIAMARYAERRLTLLAS